MNKYLVVVSLSEGDSYKLQCDEFPSVHETGLVQLYLSGGALKILLPGVVKELTVYKEVPDA